MPKTPLIASVGVHCHPGKVRSENQDRISRSGTPFGDLYVLADGVGGQSGGAEAALSTAEGFSVRLPPLARLPVADALQQAAASIGEDLKLRAPVEGSRMSSTVVLAVVRDSTATIGHLGDSRAYLMRGGRLKQLTRDHSVVQRLIDQGLLTPAQARDHPDSSKLTGALGQRAEAVLEIGTCDLEAGDTLLLCSDGLWAFVEEAEIEAIVASPGLSAQVCADALLDLALEAGGEDNISMQVLRFSASVPVVYRRFFLGMPASRSIALLAACGAIILAGAVIGVDNFRHPIRPAGVISATRAPLLLMGSAEANQPGWVAKLSTLDYLNVTPSSLPAACPDLARSTATLYYSETAKTTAQRISADLKLPPGDAMPLPAGHPCGDARLLVVPAKR